jgi:predicted Zn-dependent peptidase
LRQLFTYKPEILYYGPATVKQLKKSLSASYKLPKSFGTPPPAKKFDRLPTDRNVVYYAPYPAKQSRLITINRAGKLDTKLIPIVRMYNQYFGGSMNAIVFQEMREKRSLAYTAQSSFIIPSDTADYMYNYSFIGTQNDKIMDALTAFDSLFNAMPVSQSAFDLAKEGARNSIATNRITKMAILTTYLNNRRMGLDHDYRKDFYELINGFTLNDIVKFNKQYIKDKPKTYMILATDGEVNLDAIAKQFGPVTKLTLEDIFGY